MADLVTHLCSALLPGAWLRGRYLGAVVLGTALPDLVSRVPPLAMDLFEGLGWIDLPDVALMPWGVYHEPLPLVLTCGLVATWFIARDRAGVFLGLLGGCALHIGLDVLQDHHGEGYFLCAPLSLTRFELGWIGSEATVVVAPWLALATALAWGWRWHRSATKVTDEGPRPPSG